MNELSVLEQLEKWQFAVPGRDCILVPHHGLKKWMLSVITERQEHFTAYHPTILDCLQDKTIQEVINP